MSLWKTFQSLVAGDAISTVKAEAQEAAVMLLRRDLELTAVNEKLKDLNDAKADFMAMAAHQLRTPITNIRWNMELLSDENQYTYTQNQKQHLDTVQTSVRHMSEMIDTLLYISRLELGTNTVLATDFDMETLIRDAVGRFTTELSHKHITPTVNVALLPMHADRSLFDVIAQNIISNAIKYSPPNGDLTVTCHTLDPRMMFGGRRYTQTQFAFSVQDTGYGIPESEKEKIFTRMFRARNAREKGISGTGLGLYLVKLIATQLGGEVWFISHEDKGTTFYVTIPYALVKPIGE